jgi:hypothetical protein
MKQTFFSPTAQRKFLNELDEKKLFVLVKEFYILDLIDLNEENDSSSIDWYSASLDCWIEAKCRTEHFNHLMIEKKKWDALKEKKQAYYICSTEEGVFEFDITSIVDEPVWSYRNCRTTTQFTDNRYIPKLQGQLPSNKAKQIKDFLFNGF